jgi:hypothetical protein
MRDVTSFLKRCLCACAGSAIAIAAPVAMGQQADCPPDTPFDIVFSNDIGADTELSDPFFDGDEVFDPGDLYLWLAGLAGPANGVLDDAFAFGFDPFPDPFVAGSGAPTCSGIPPQQLTDWFDLDGADVIDLDLRQLINPDGPNQQPIPFFNTQCVYEARHLLLSWDDDIAPHYTGAAGLPCPIPVITTSPFVGATFGSTGANDEVLSVTVSPAVPQPGFPPIVPFLDERGLNPSLAPNPDGIEQQDDDTDALDVILGQAGQDNCPFWYWSSDHEATLGTDPGDIYLTFLFAPGPNITPVIDGAIHLGLPERTDIDAFEFVWVESDPGGGGTSPLALAILFSVDDDDPLTAPDESGGLAPDALYISYFTGFNIQYTPKLEEDIDAVTNWCAPFGGDESACCLCDGTCVNVASETDCVALGGKWQGPGSDCATIDCEPFGACCLPDGSCIDMVTKNECEGPLFAGIYQGDCLDCTQVDCLPQTEACCFCDGTCADLLVSDCLNAGGIPQGPGTFCATVTCPRVGACCLCDGQCIDNVTAAACQSNGGVWQGPCTDCATIDCEPFGACCLCDGTCIPNISQSACIAQGGKYQGDCTTCDNDLCIPFGACCLPDGNCVDMLTQAECEGPAFGGVYQGDCTDCDNVICDEPTACCLCDGTCVEVLPIDCLAQGGKVFPNTPCTQIDCVPFGACCLPDGSCVDMVTQAECEGPGGLGGVYQGDCVTCDDVDCPIEERGSCCFGCEQYPGGPPLFCIDVASRDECCELQGLFVPGVPCSQNICDALCPADLNGDGRVDVFDFSILASNFGAVGAPGRCRGDLNCDGRVDVFDFGILSSNFGCVGLVVPNQCCSP